MTRSGWKDFDTLESFIAKEEHLHPSSRGMFSHLLRRIGLATKVISAKVQKAGLTEMLGEQGAVNVQGERQKKLDVLANDIMRSTLQWMPSIAGLASEEDDEPVSLPPAPGRERGYVVLFDPLDGSSNIDANIPVGTIFSIHRRVTSGDLCTTEDFLQPGHRQVAAGYVIYGASTMFVYTTGNGVHGFTLDPEVGEYVLSHENIRVPDSCTCFSANERNLPTWEEPIRRFVDRIRTGAEPRHARTSSRYIGTMVADFHRNLLYGGIFLYPADARTGKGKLRLLYECSPLAFVMEQAGGAASTGRRRILDLIPTGLHERVPVVIGNRHEVEMCERMIAEAERA